MSPTPMYSCFSNSWSKLHVPRNPLTSPHNPSSIFFVLCNGEYVNGLSANESLNEISSPPRGEFNSRKGVNVCFFGDFGEERFGERLSAGRREKAGVGGFGGRMAS